MSSIDETLSRAAHRGPESAPAAASQLRSPLDLSRRIPELDGLRGVAIGMVVFLHLVTIAIVARPPQLLGYVNAGSRIFWSGVDLFFVLSGFLIAGILLDARDSPNYYRTFYIRRFCRIVPVYLLLLSLVGIGHFWVLGPAGAHFRALFGGKVPWYAYLLFAQNLWMTKSNSTGSPILSVTWSLAVEEQFYLLLPVIIRFVRRTTLPSVFFAGIVFAPIARLTFAFWFPTKLFGTYVLLPCRIDALFAGALCAYYLREPQAWNWLVKHRSGLWTAFFVLLAGMLCLNSTLNARFFPSGPGSLFVLLAIGYGWILLFYANGLILALTDPQSLLSRAMRWRWLGGLGTIAYGVYLFHVGIYGFWEGLLISHSWNLDSWRSVGVTLLAVASIVVFGGVSWRYIERPAVRWSHRWQYWSANRRAVKKSINSAELRPPAIDTAEARL